MAPKKVPVEKARTAGKPPAKAEPAKAVPAGPAGAPRPPFRRPAQSLNFAGVGRNDMCPCGSGKRFKNCHG
jgi:preprotein translocase subunit SecA